MTSTDKFVHLLDFLGVFKTLYKLIITFSMTALLRQIGLVFDLCKLFPMSEHEAF